MMCAISKNGYQLVAESPLKGDSLIGIQFRNVSCKVNQFLAHVCDFASVWLIVLVGCERLILLYRKTRTLTTEK
ncbi:hypothetical protein ANCDUO_06791 [Ancylostoma duodenale]|uniref:Uncharacterized protein n=1 Tax=Ancylostoma duodenale TaxID=51022 RepID=A0A0C2DK86_9BILA|nr:hypothetical protein ANCDUO_06791 [Ancylostoma duodenale]